MIERTMLEGGIWLYRPKVNVKDCRPEWPEQVDVVAWIREYYPGDARLMFHPANEGDIPPQYRQDQIKAGLLKGVSDLIFLKGGAHHPGAVIEMKRCWWKSRPSSEQIEFLQSAANDGKFAAICNGADAAKIAFMEYKKGLKSAESSVKVVLPIIGGGAK